MTEVERTQPGSENEWRITYDTGSQKWTNDRPGDGVGEASPEMLKETYGEPAVQRGLDGIAHALEKGRALDGPVNALVRDVGVGKAKVLLNDLKQRAPESQKEGWEEAREMVAGIKDVVNKIFKVFHLDKAKEVAERVVDFWRNKNQKSDLTPQEQRALYRPVDYGERLPLTKKRKLDVGWTDHAEYRSDLRDVDPEEVNEAIRDRLRQKLNPPQKKKQKFKEPGVGTMVVDYNTKKNPAEADVVTVWASDLSEIVDQNPGLVERVEKMFGMRWNGDGFDVLSYPDIPRSEVDSVDNAPGGITAAVMDRIDPENVQGLWFENEEGDRWYPDMSGDGYPGDVPEGFVYQRYLDTSLKDGILKTVQEDEVEACDHPADYRVTDHGLIDGMEGERCNKCGGNYVRKVGEAGENWEASGSVPVMSGSSGWADDLVLAMANKGIPLYKAIIIAASACERCMNSLAHENGLDWGYPEMSEDWKKCGTICDFCQHMGYQHPGRLPAIEASVRKTFIMAALEKEISMKDFDIAKELVEVARELTAANTFEVYGMEYPKDSKHADQMSQYLESPFEGRFEENMWNAVRDWGKKNRASSKDMKAILKVIDTGAANHVLKRAVRSLSDVERVAERIGI